jgi:hypothetical protein
MAEGMDSHLRWYAEEAASWTHGMKTEDELLQRIWNLSRDVIRLLKMLEVQRGKPLVIQRLVSEMEDITDDDLRYAIELMPADARRTLRRMLKGAERASAAGGPTGATHQQP